MEPDEKCEWKWKSGKLSWAVVQLPMEIQLSSCLVKVKKRK